MKAITSLILMFDRRKAADKAPAIKSEHHNVSL